jgi:hypothetical protein
MNLLDTLIIAAVFFGITLLAHIAICKLGSSGSFMLKGAVLGCISTTGCAVYMLYIGRFDITGPYILFSAWLFYLMVFINLLNSVTLKMLASLYNAPSSTLSVQDFAHTFNTEDGFETRLAMLHSSKLIQQRGAAITLTPKARSLLTIVHQVKTVLSID